MTHAHDDRPDLTRLTDAQARALLGSTDDVDINAACEAGLMRARHSYDNEGEDCEVVSFTDDADRILSEAQRIADGLSDEQVETLSLAGHGSSPIRFVMQSARWGAEMAAMVGRLRALGLMDDCPISDRPRQTPAARLVLALRERSKETP